MKEEKVSLLATSEASSDVDSEQRRRQRRMEDEIEMARQLGAIVDHHNRDIIKLRKVDRDVLGRDNHNLPNDFTKAEKKIFHIDTYRNHTLGVMAGGLTLAALYGLSHLRGGGASSGSTKFLSRWQSSSSSSTNSAARARTLQAIEGRIATSSTTRSSKHNGGQSPSARPTHENHTDAIGSIQNIVFMATALVVTIVTSNASFDRQAYYQGISTIPLQPGRSVFCHRACPSLIDKYQQFINQHNNNNNNEESKRKRFFFKSSSSSPSTKDNGSTTTAAQLPNGSSPQELWENPTSDDLDSMKILVLNCRQRQAFAAQIQQQQQQLDNDGVNNNTNTNHTSNNKNNILHEEEHNIVEIPEPGVPPNFLGVSVSSDNNNMPLEHQQALNLTTDR